MIVRLILYLIFFSGLQSNKQHAVQSSHLSIIIFHFPDRPMVQKVQMKYLDLKNMMLNKTIFKLPDVEELSQEQRKLMRTKGHTYLKTKKIAFIILAGDMPAKKESDCLFTPFRPEMLSALNKGSETRSGRPAPENLFQSIVGSCLENKVQRKWKEIIFYIVCHRGNRKIAIKQVENVSNKYTGVNGHLQFYIFFQPESCILRGGFAIDKDNPKMYRPNGMGSFLESRIYFSPTEFMSLRQHIKMIEVEYMYGVGTNNLKEKGIDPALIGKLSAKSTVDMVFKCAKPTQLDSHNPRVVQHKLQGRYQWVVMEYSNLIKLAKSPTQIQYSPYWINSFACRCQTLLKQIKKTSVIDKESITHEFFQQELEGENSKDICVGRCLISKAVMNINFKCEGILSQEFEKLEPVDFLLQ